MARFYSVCARYPEQARFAEVGLFPPQSRNRRVNLITSRFFICMIIVLIVAYVTLAIIVIGQQVGWVSSQP